MKRQILTYLTVLVSLMTYSQTETKLKGDFCDSRDTLVLKEYRELGAKEIIEDKTLVFKINFLDKESLNLTLIGVIESYTIRLFGLG